MMKILTLQSLTFEIIFRIFFFFFMEQFVLKQLVLVNSLHMRLMFLILFDTSDFYGPYSLIVTM